MRMLRKLENVPTYLWIIMFVTFVNKSCGSANFLFKQKTVPSVAIAKKVETDSPWWFSGLGEKQQLCHYARMEVDLPYMDYSITNNWHEQEKNGVTNVIRCPTLPTMFLLKRDWVEIIQITFLESGIDDIVFNTEVIEEAKIVFWYEQESRKRSREPNRLAHLSADDRKNLCAAARKYVNVVFLDKKVPTARMYKFLTASNQEEVHITISCPTAPKLCVCLGKSENEVKLLVVRDSIDSFDFEFDKTESTSVLPCESLNLLNEFRENDLLRLDIDSREALCKIARQYAAIPVTDSDVREAELYLFNYDGKKEERDIALRCKMLPEMYLRLVDPRKKIIKITLVRNQYERFIYTTEFFDYILEANDVKELRKKKKKHWFTTLTDDDRWKLCYAVQKRIPHFLRLKTIPQRYIKPPKMRNFVLRYPLHGISEDIDDVAIKCSGLPEVYVRVIQQSENDEIKVIQIAINIDYFNLPRLSTLPDDYHEQQDNYDE